MACSPPLARNKVQYVHVLYISFVHDDTILSIVMNVCCRRGSKTPGKTPSKTPATQATKTPGSTKTPISVSKTPAKTPVPVAQSRPADVRKTVTDKQDGGKARPRPISSGRPYSRERTSNELEKQKQVRVETETGAC